MFLDSLSCVFVSPESEHFNDLGQTKLIPRPGTHHSIYNEISFHDVCGRVPLDSAERFWKKILKSRIVGTIWTFMLKCSEVDVSLSSLTNEELSSGGLKPHTTTLPPPCFRVALMMFLEFFLFLQHQIQDFLKDPSQSGRCKYFLLNSANMSKAAPPPTPPFKVSF